MTLVYHVSCKKVDAGRSNTGVRTFKKEFTDILEFNEWLETSSEYMDVTHWMELRG